MEILGAPWFVGPVGKCYREVPTSLASSGSPHSFCPLPWPLWDSLYTFISAVLYLERSAIFSPTYSHSKHPSGISWNPDVSWQPPFSFLSPALQHPKSVPRNVAFSYTVPIAVTAVYMGEGSSLDRVLGLLSVRVFPGASCASPTLSIMGPLVRINCRSPRRRTWATQTWLKQAITGLALGHFARSFFKPDLWYFL